MHEQNVVLGTPQLGAKLCISMQLMSLRRQGKFIALRDDCSRPRPGNNENQGKVMKYKLPCLCRMMLVLESWVLYCPNTIKGQLL